MRFAAVAMAMLAGACAGPLSTLDPAGGSAARIALLWWVMLAGAVLILVGVVGAAVLALRFKAPGRRVSERGMLIGGGLVFTGGTVLALLVWGLLVGGDLTARADPRAVRVQAHAFQWGWRFTHPDGAVTLDELHLPAGRAIHVAVTAQDVIHSFWIPRLGGKIDAIPGKTNVLALEPAAPGVYRGECAEFCGIGHTGMGFVVHVHPEGGYRTALADTAGGRP